MPTLREQALAAAAEVHTRLAEGDEEFRREGVALIRQQFRTDFGIDVKRIEHRDDGPSGLAGDVVFAEDLELIAAVVNGEVSWRLLGTCPRCGEACPSLRILTLTQLGQQLTEFEPAFDHHCQDPTVAAEADDQRLVRLARELFALLR